MNAYWKYNLKYSKSLHFPKLVNPIQDLSQLTSGLTDVNENRSVRIGRSWKVDELRLKSDSDLHKLWYVLVKERLALRSDQYFGVQLAQTKQSNDRLIKQCLTKVHVSMSRLRTVIGERINVRNEFMTFLEFYYIRKMQNDPNYKIAAEAEESVSNVESEVKSEEKPTQETVQMTKQVETIQKVEKKVEAPKKKVVIRGAISSDKNKSVVNEEKESDRSAQNEEFVAPRIKKQIISVLTEDEKMIAQSLTQKFSEKELLNEYISNPYLLHGKERRKVRAVIDATRSTQAKNIFMKEMSAVAYKYKSLKQSQNPQIRKLENLA